MFKAYATTSESLPFTAPGITILETTGNSYHILAEYHGTEVHELCDEGYFDEDEADAVLGSISETEYRRSGPWRRKGAQYYCDVTAKARQ